MNFALDTQIASQPAAIARVLAQVEVPTLDAGRPLIFAGIGTSLHACRINVQGTRWQLKRSHRPVRCLSAAR